MNNYKFMSIDESSKKTGCALFINGELIDYCLIDKSADKDSGHRLNEMCRDVLQKLKEWKPNYIVIEHPQGDGRNVLVVWMLSQIIGVARAYAIERGCVFEEVMPSEWRRMLGIQQGKKKRAELKQLSIDYVKEVYDKDVPEDVADAICIGSGVLKKYA